MLLLPGRILGDRYEIIEKIGSGGMSDVYKARCTKLNRNVAIKVLKDEYKEDKNFVKKFKVEAQSAASLSHINIVNVYDVGEDEGVYYIVMELVEGCTLKEFIKAKGTIEEPEAIEIATQIASGIEHAHRNHIIHRDIKPQNIIISYDGIVKVTDFGIARAASCVTITANATGSVHYISPEQARNGYSDERSDIYSLGITMFEMLTGKLPYEGDNTVSIALQHIQGEVVKPSDVKEGISPSIEAVVMKMIQKKSEQRYQNISEVLLDFRKAVKDPSYIAPISIKEADEPTVIISDREMEQINKGIDSLSGGDTTTDNKKEKKSFFFEDYEDEKEPLEDIANPKSEEKTSALDIILIVLAIIFAIGIVAFGTIFAINKINESREKNVTVVPNIKGLTIEEAKNKLLAKDLELSDEIEYEYNEEIAKGIIMAQSVDAEQEVTKGAKIKVSVSKGYMTYKVPNVVGKKFNDAEMDIGESHLTVSREIIYDETTPMGVVIRQYPAAGTDLRYQEVVTIVVSNGKEKQYTKVPYLKNLTKEDAIQAIKDANLEPGQVTELESEIIAEGNVISQSVAANTEVEEFYVVDLVVSKGGPKYYTEEVLLAGIFDELTVGGMVKLEVEQEGSKKIAYEKYIEAAELPFGVQVQGKEGTAKINVYVDDVFINMSYTVTFGMGN